MFTFIIGLLLGSYLTFRFHAKIAAAWKSLQGAFPVPNLAEILRKHRAEQRPHIVEFPNGKFAVRKKDGFGNWKYRDNGVHSSLDFGWWSELHGVKHCLVDTIEEARKLRGHSGKAKMVE